MSPRTRRLVLIGLPMVLSAVWLFYVTFAGHWGRVVDHWESTATMIFGSFVAGSTPQGGGAIAFPVFTKALQVPASVARTFSLCIQAAGMSTAALAIVISGKRIERRVVLVGGTSGVAGFLGALFLLADPSTPFWESLMPAPYVKVTFTVLLAAMAYITYLALEEGDCGEEHMPFWNARVWGGLVAAGLLGGVATALLGSGVDVMIFLFIVILAGLHPRVGVPTSVLTMAVLSVAGFLVLGLFDGQLDVVVNQAGDVVAVGGTAVGPYAPGQYDIFGLWLAAIPVVVFGAPLGTMFVHYLSEKNLIRFLAGMAVTEVVTTAIFLEDLRRNPTLLFYGVAGMIVVIVGVTVLHNRRMHLLDYPADVGARMLARKAHGHDPEETAAHRAGLE